MLELSAVSLAAKIRGREVSSQELVSQCLRQIERTQQTLNATVVVLAESALQAAAEADRLLASGTTCGPLHGVPFSVKDSLDVAGVRTTAGTLGHRHAPPAEHDATLVARLRAAGAIPIAKTNLPDLLFSFETDNLVFGRTNNPYNLKHTPGGSSGGESALLAACGSPIGLGSDALGSVRVPAAFCGITSIKPTSGRLPRTGHVPPRGSWVEALWQIGPMARHVEDLQLMLSLLAFPDNDDFTSPPVPLSLVTDVKRCRVAYFTTNGFASPDPAIAHAVEQGAAILSNAGLAVEPAVPPGLDYAYELELALIGADGTEGVQAYLQQVGSHTVHPYLTHFLEKMRVSDRSTAALASRWAQWDKYREDMRRFFSKYDVVLSPVYTQTALAHGGSQLDENFRGFSYTMAWNLAGAPAATVRVSEHEGLPVNVQVIAKPWDDAIALAVCRLLEESSGGWQLPPVAG